MDGLYSFRGIAKELMDDFFVTRKFVDLGNNIMSLTMASLGYKEMRIHNQ